MTKLFVFDTNSLISSAILPESVNGQAFFKALKSDLILSSDKTYAELRRVLFSEKFDKYLPDPLDRISFLQNFLAASVFIVPTITVEACRDPKDDKFLELAVAGKADCIITGDKDLLVLHPFRGIPIMTASDFLDNF